MAGSDPDDSQLPAPFLTALSRRQWTVVCFVLGAALFFISGWLWYTQLYSTPQRVFWGMINNNLSARGVTRTITESQGGNSSQQIISLSFNGDVQAHSVATIGQTGSDNQTNTVVSETIGTVSADYIRYLKISPDDGRFASTLNIWAKADGDGQRSNFLLESMFGLAPVANLTPVPRRALVDQMQSRHIYDVDYSKLVHKSEKGRDVLVYDVTLNLEGYLQILNNYLQTIGMPKDSQFDPSQYAGQTAAVTMTIDKLSHQLVSVAYDNSNRIETYTDYGVVDTGKLPTDTIGVDVLQKRLQATLQ